MLKVLTKIVGDPNARELKKLQPLVDEINSLESEMAELNDEQLRDQTAELKQRLAEGEPLEDLLPDAFAAVRESSKRTLGMRHFDVQLLGGMVLHQGKIAEMRTGEGKTLVATLPAYLNALEGKGVHIVTVNDYLAKRDAEWMGTIYNALGLTVGCIQSTMEPYGEEKRAAYAADITYGTNNEFGFDYLRDNMITPPMAVDQYGRLMIGEAVPTQRPLHYAIVDEVDNILIDEARTPLIISGPAEEATDRYYQFAHIVKELRPEQDYVVDEKLKAVSLTEDGIAKVERLANVENIYDEQNYTLAHYLDNALKAEVIFKNDRDYIVENGQVIIIDEFTGRKMYGRRYSEGLHQAIEGKEGVRVERENKTLGTITFQNYFRLYNKLAGMTGTAQTEAEELHKIYKLEVVTIPTNKLMVRRDAPDFVYKNEKGKFKAVVEQIEELYQAGKPVLVGTVSIEKSERLSQQLNLKGIPHEVLNAKNHEREAGIIAQAGRKGAVTVATNMAGRGVDILLGGNPEGLAKHEWEASGGEKDYEALLAKYKAQCAEQHDEVVGMGGLTVVGTERHESRRIDNQLRGRAGRQGDPGSSRFFVSLDDDLMRRFASERIANIMEKLGMDEDTPIEHNLVSRAIEQAQTKVEGFHFDIRKHAVEFDDVMNEQRRVIYGERQKILKKEDLKESVLDMVHEQITQMIGSFCSDEYGENWDTEGLLAALRPIFPVPEDWNAEDFKLMTLDELNELVIEAADKAYEAKEEQLGAPLMRHVERLVLLRVIDTLWVEHLTTIEDLREGIGLRAYGQQDPLVAYKAEAYDLFQGLMSTIQHDVVHTIYHVNIVVQPTEPVMNPTAESESVPLPPPRERLGLPLSEAKGEGTPAESGDGRRAAKSYGRSAYAGATANRQDAAARRPVAAGSPKIGRNEPCPCGSGRKYKKCHGAAA
ncbi:MAG TPA: preprotein translocase subunit SecA [Chloroflexota bacterium]|nr:preprotein translocase subunit SecA [Chloroflexota bacterium]